MIIVEKVITVKLDGEIIYHPQKNIKVIKKKIQKEPVFYDLPQDISETMDKSIMLKRFIRKAKKQELDYIYLKAIINIRDFLTEGLNFLKNIEKLQYNSIIKDEIICSTTTSNSELGTIKINNG
jgi:CO dehydrogenase/acetyl-CoA synthase gamma subunit (corrinoid Fe-S protein)